MFFKQCALLAGVCLLPLAPAAAELGVGATREEVMAQLGAPKSKMGTGGREIFSYPKGRIVFEEGKVASIDWKGPLPVLPDSVRPSSVNPPAPSPVAPVPRSEVNSAVESPTVNPVPPAVGSAAVPLTAQVKPRAAPVRDVWWTDFVAAQAEAAATKRRLLVLFTGSDWCPPCIQFEANIAHAEDFLNVTRAAFVLVKLDYPRNTPQPAAVRARNEELRKRYGVASYPSLLVISADGAKSARVDTTKRRQADSMLDYFVQAVDEARRAKEKSSFWPW